MIKRSRVRAGGSINTSTRESSARASILPRSRSRAFAAAFTAENALVNVNVNVNAERTFTFAPTMDISPCPEISASPVGDASQNPGPRPPPTEMPTLAGARQEALEGRRLEVR